MGTITFYGATGTVTGSKYLVQHDGFRLLIDCGLFQGLKELRLRNWSPPPFEPSSIDLVALTHAHLDHTGYLPVLLNRDCSAKILATRATKALCGIILPDSGHLQEEDARFANKKGFSKHKPALPLYTLRDGQATAQRIETVSYGTPIEVHPRIVLTWRPAGHLLGASSIEVRLRAVRAGDEDRVVVFSGDLGRWDQPIVPDPSPLPPCDQLVLESTYGNRDHPRDDPKTHIAEIAKETFEKGGVLLIPSFAVGRTQQLLFLLNELRDEDRLPKDIPIYVNSPMAVRSTRLTVRHEEALDEEMRDANSNGDDPLGLDYVNCVEDAEGSKRLNGITYPAIIISASGMLEGGRILHHLVRMLPDHRTTVLFAGYQAVGTRGRALQEGRPTIKIHGREVHVRARIETLDGLSGHADRGEIQRWLSTWTGRPARVHLTHGEPEARDALAELLRMDRGLEVNCPDYTDKVDV